MKKTAAKTTAKLDPVTREIKELQRKQEVEAKRNVNRARLFALIERIAAMEAHPCTHGVGYEFVRAIKSCYRDEQTVPGLLIKYRYKITSGFGTEIDTVMWKDDTEELHIDSEDHEFDSVDDYLLIMEEEAEAEQKKKRKKASIIRAMKVADRELLYPNWRDPFPDDKVDDLADAIVASEPKPKRTFTATVEAGKRKATRIK